MYEKKLRRRKLSSDEQDDILMLRLEGRSLKQIREKLKCDMQLILDFLHTDHPELVRKYNIQKDAKGHSIAYEKNKGKRCFDCGVCYKRQHGKRVLCRSCRNFWIYKGRSKIYPEATEKERE